MSGRYFITGVQLGMLKANLEFMSNVKIYDNTERMFNEIEKNQFIGNMPEPYEKYKIAICEYVVKDNETTGECPICKQIDVGQTGEYPCPKCGLPQTWDESFTQKFDIMQVKKNGKKD